MARGTTAATITGPQPEATGGGTIIVEHNLTPQARKERKRATDRVAQREHRRRQKLYVDELEEQIRVLKQESMNDKVGGALWLENERLRKELKDLKAFYSAIESLVHIHGNLPTQSAKSSASAPGQESAVQADPTDSRDSSQAQQSQGLHSGDLSQGNAPYDAELSNSPKGQQDEVSQTEPNETQQSIPGEIYLEDISVMAPPQNSEQLNGNTSAMRDWWGITDQEMAQFDQMAYASDTPLWLNNFFAIGSLSPSGQFNDIGNPIAYNAPTNQVSENRNSPRPSMDIDMTMLHDTHLENAHVGPSTQPLSHDTPKALSVTRGSTGGSPDSSRTKFEVQIHRSLSHVLLPPMPQDIYVHEIIERARSNTLSRRMLLDAPTLADFLVDNSTNVLSRDLKKYLEPVRRSRRTAEYLGTYWVSYLLLRWQVNQSEESFARIPPWFRPTDIQMHVPHPIAIDFVAWPRLRDELVQLSLVEPDKVYEVMTTIGVYLELNLESTLAKSLTNEEVLNAAVCDLRNWKLREGFFDIYPQWKGMCEPTPDLDGDQPA